MRYQRDDRLTEKARNIARAVLPYIRPERVVCVRSYGSKARGVIARCHTLSKPLQLALGINGVYVIEVLSERFDKLSEEEQEKVLLHELMHIPRSMGGGFRHHNYVNRRNVEKFYRLYKEKQNSLQEQCWQKKVL